MPDCPACGKPSDADWPVEVNGKIVDGGCQDCWEKQCDESWWEMARRLPAPQGPAHD
jgi:hypothetical protein